MKYLIAIEKTTGLVVSVLRTANDDAFITPDPNNAVVRVNDTLGEEIKSNPTNYKFNFDTNNFVKDK